MDRKGNVLDLTKNITGIFHSPDHNSYKIEKGEIDYLLHQHKTSSMSILDRLIVKFRPKRKRSRPLKKTRSQRIGTGV